MNSKSIHSISILLASQSESTRSLQNRKKRVLQPPIDKQHYELCWTDNYEFEYNNEIFADIYSQRQWRIKSVNLGSIRNEGNVENATEVEYEFDDDYVHMLIIVLADSQDKTEKKFINISSL